MQHSNFVGSQCDVLLSMENFVSLSIHTKKRPREREREKIIFLANFLFKITIISDVFLCEWVWDWKILLPHLFRQINVNDMWKWKKENICVQTMIDLNCIVFYIEKWKKNLLLLFVWPTHKLKQEPKFSKWKREML